MVPGSEGTNHGPRPGRMLLVLLLLVVLGLPLTVIGQLAQSRGLGPVSRGSQPGGTIKGEVVDAKAQPIAGVPVEVYLVESKVLEESKTRTITSADGSFEAVVPSVQGCYLVKIGGGAWQLDTAEYSFLDSSGEPLEEARDLRFEARPGCTLVVRIERNPGKPVKGGRAELRGTWRPSRLLSLVPLQVIRREKFSGGDLLLDGLPPLKGVVHVQLDSGDELEFEVNLAEAGDQQEHKFVLQKL